MDGDQGFGNHLPLPGGYNIQAQDESNDSYTSPPTVPGYIHGALLDQQSYHDSISTVPYQYGSSFDHSPRFSPPSITTDQSSFRSANGVSEPRHASISTSALSSVSSSYDSHQSPSYVAHPSYTSSVTQTHQFARPTGFTGYRQSSGSVVSHEFSPQSSPFVHNGFPTRPQHQVLAYAHEREPYISSHHSNRTQLSSNGYDHYTESPRVHAPVHHVRITSLQGGHSHPQSNMPPSSGNQRDPQNDCVNFPFSEFQHIADVKVNGRPVEFDIKPRMEKGFFKAQDEDQNWTCYRRNYFSVSCTYTIGMLHLPGGTMTVARKEGGESEVKAIGISMSAVTDGADGKAIELIQYTAKRDNGDKDPIKVVKVIPGFEGAVQNTHHSHPPQHMGMYHGAQPPMMPVLPFQHVVDDQPSASSSQNQTPPSSQFVQTAYGGTVTQTNILSSVTFDRIQFKTATANNGKRRAAQQFFHLRAEIWVDVRETIDDPPNWVKAAQRVSAKIVVRGRSPSHYNDQGQSRNGYGRHGGAGGSSNYNGTLPSTSYGAMGHNVGGFRSGHHQPPHWDPGYDDYYYQTANPDMDPHSGSDSAEEAVSDEEHPGYRIQLPALYSEADEFAPPPSYTHHAGPIFIHDPNPPPTEEMRDYGPREYGPYNRWTMNADFPDAKPGPGYEGLPAGRMQGMPSSHTVFPDLRGPSRRLL